ncbi:MAG: cytochrome c biogenesis protein CcsA [Bacteroidetes bacterium]|nr:cytochrome c biogenesis protein CcsA [Bacteroidota bacterium]
MEYIGEHLGYGNFGHFLILLSLVASLVATISFFIANKQVETIAKDSWLRIARLSFLTQTIAVFVVFGLLLFLISNHYHEYFFVWNHSSRTLQKEYLLACIWEDQSGSFLLWSLWNCVLGWIFIWRQKKFEAPVLTVVSFAQFCIATMIAGVYLFEQKIGNNPFALLRNELNAPMLFQKADYLSFPKIYEGNDLNVLLQNYWMVIHPPVLFLGFASTIIPFGFAFHGLVNKDESWVKAAIPWTSFSAGILGLGIMMGAAWAYESLSFGGYWAWDPVENASLVPWITLVAGLHTNLIYKSTGYSLRSTYFFYIISFVLVLYSTFLTRSGILGDTSVHAFTGADMTLQLLLYVLIFFVPLLVLFFIRYKSIPSIKKEEETYSREFWMFIGSLVLFLSAAVIIAKTSIPVYNKIFGTNIAPPAEQEFAHNQIQIFVAIIIGVLTALTQYFKFKNTDKKSFFRKLLVPTVAALVCSVLISLFGNINYDKFGVGFLAAIHIAIFSSVYAVIANAFYLFTDLKGKFKFSGASVAHVGFGLVLVGVLISSSKKAVLSWNTTGIAVFKKSKAEDPAENITLFKGVRTDMQRSNYHVTYVKNVFDEHTREKKFELKFEDKNSGEIFTLHPNALKANKGMEGYSFNPDKKHYWHKDIFVYISSFMENSIDDTATFNSRTMKVGDTTFYNNGRIILTGVEKNIDAVRKVEPKADAGILLKMSVIAKDGTTYEATPKVALVNGEPKLMADTVLSQSLVVKFNKLIDGATNTFEIGVKESKQVSELVTLKVYEFPMINILWIGIIVMVIGFLISVRQRIK